MKNIFIIICLNIASYQNIEKELESLTIGNAQNNLNMVKKSVGDYVVIDSGVFHTQNLPLKIEVNSMKIQITFKNDEKLPESHIQSDVDEIDTTKLNLILYNFNNVLGSGFLEPTEFGTFEGVKYFLTALVNGFSNGSKQLTYTILTKG